MSELEQILKSLAEQQNKTNDTMMKMMKRLEDRDGKDDCKVGDSDEERRASGGNRQRRMTTKD